MLQTWIYLCLLTNTLLFETYSTEKSVAVQFLFLIFNLLL
jgi:hypothetical protein